MNPDHRRTFFLLGSLLVSIGLSFNHAPAVSLYMAAALMKIYAYYADGSNKEYSVLVLRLCMLELYQYNVIPTAVVFMFYYFYKYIDVNFDRNNKFLDILLAFSFPAWVAGIAQWVAYFY